MRFRPDMDGDAPSHDEADPANGIRRGVSSVHRHVANVDGREAADRHMPRSKMMGRADRLAGQALAPWSVRVDKGNGTSSQRPGRPRADWRRLGQETDGTAGVICFVHKSPVGGSVSRAHVRCSKRLTGPGCHHWAGLARWARAQERTGVAGTCGIHPWTRARGAGGRPRQGTRVRRAVGGGRLECSSYLWMC